MSTAQETIAFAEDVAERLLSTAEALADAQRKLARVALLVESLEAKARVVDAEPGAAFGLRLAAKRIRAALEGP